MIRRFPSLVLIGLATLWVLPVHAGPAPRQYLVCQVATGTRPAAIVAADFDRNGLADFAVLDESGKQVWVVRTDAVLFAVGACREGVIDQHGFPVGDQPQGLAVADFDRNGKMDIVVVEGRGARVLEGDGTGRFTSQAPIPAGSDPQSVAVADFDGDGVEDIAVGTGSDRTVAVLYGIAGGGFLEPPVLIRLDQMATRMVAADLNLDGAPDLALVSLGGGTATILLRDRDRPRGFERPVSFAVGELPTALAVGDFDRDGTPDLAVTVHGTAGEGTLKIFFGTRTNEGVGFTSRQPFPVATGANPAAVVATDVDGDGRLDVAVANEGDHSVGFYTNRGDGTLQSTDPCPGDECPDTCCVGQGPRVLTAAYLDADALPEVVVGSEQDGLLTFLFSSNPPATPTHTPTETATLTPTPSLTGTVSKTPTQTATPTATVTTTDTATRSPTITRTPTITSTKTPGPFSLQGDSCAVTGVPRNGKALLWTLSCLIVVRLRRFSRVGAKHGGTLDSR